MGSIVNVSSQMGQTALSKMMEASVYASSKAAVDMMIKYAAMENAKRIRVNNANPGLIKTDMTGGFSEDAVGKMQLIGRKGTVEEVANVVAFLASD